MLYDDRLIIECNLIQAYDSIMQFIVKHMPEIPFIDGTLRLPLRDVIMREVVLNMLIHREYSGGGASCYTHYISRHSYCRELEYPLCIWQH